MPNGDSPDIGKAQIRLLEYDDASFKEGIVKDINEFGTPPEQFKVRWIRVIGLEDEETIKNLAESLGVHQLTLEDVLNLNQRPKIEEFNNYAYVVLRIFDYSLAEEKLLSAQLSILIFSNSIITFEERRSKLLNDVEDQLRLSRGVIRMMGVDRLLYLIMDSAIDACFYVLEKIEERIQELEDELTSNPASRTLRSIHELKRNLIQIQRNLWPLREVIGKLERAGYKFIREQMTPFFRDLHDNIVMAIDNIEMLHSTLSDMLDIYFSAVSTKLNEVMKVLTMIATIFMPLTFIAGIYGMNFKYMPELELAWAYPAVLLIMLGIGLGMLVYFRRKGWI